MDATGGGGDLMNFADRFWARVERGNPSECWAWTGFVGKDGYGQFGFRVGESPKHHGQSHRVSYELLVGPVPAGLQLDHLCRVRHCVNPAHLEPVTSAENTRRGLKATKTECVRGHQFTPDNTYRDPKSGTRKCRICRREANSQAKRRKRDTRALAVADAERWTQLAAAVSSS